LSGETVFEFQAKRNHVISPQSGRRNALDFDHQKEKSLLFSSAGLAQVGERLNALDFDL